MVVFLIIHFRKDDVREEAKRGLKPSYDEDQDSEKSIGRYPSFAELCDFLHVKVFSFRNLLYFET